MRPIRVLMVINQFHPLVGGAERQAQKLAKGLIERGVDVQILTSRRPGTKKRELVDGIPVRRHRVLYIPLGRRKLGYTLFYMAYVFLYLLGRRRSFDVIHAHHAEYPAFVCSLAGRLLGKPSIVKSASSGEYFDLVKLQQKPLIGRFMAQSLCKNTDCFVAISTYIRDDLRRSGVPHEKIVLIPNGVEMSGVEPHTTADRDAPPRFVAGFVGTLLRSKNVETVLRAWAALPVHLRDECQLLIVGDGPERNRLEAYARDLDIAQCTHFCGQQADVSYWLQRMACYISMSVVEGLSNSLLEAMAHAKACIVSAGVSGNVDLIQDGENGFLVDPMDSQTLARRLALLASDREAIRRMGERALATVSQAYAMPLIVDKYQYLYRSLCEGSLARRSPVPEDNRLMAARSGSHEG